MPAFTRDQLADEQARMRKLRHLVDSAASLIMQAGMTRRDAQELVEIVRQHALRLFPGRDQTFELVYARRFSRLIDEFAVDSPGSTPRSVDIESRN